MLVNTVTGPIVFLFDFLYFIYNLFYIVRPLYRA